MAKFRTSPLVGAISGDLGGANFVAAAAAPIVRQRRTHPPAATNAAITARARMKRVNDNWRAFTDADRDQWNTLAKSLKRTNAVGLAYPRTGKALYTEHMLYALETGLTKIVTFPQAQPTDEIQSFGIVISGAQSAALVPPDGDYTANVTGLAYAAWLYSNTSTKARPPMRFVKQVSFGKPPYANLYPEALALFGEIRVGQTIAVMFRPWSSNFLARPPLWATATR